MLARDGGGDGNEVGYVNVITTVYNANPFSFLYFTRLSLIVYS